jgi:hypothetical protein
MMARSISARRLRGILPAITILAAVLEELIPTADLARCWTFLSLILLQMILPGQPAGQTSDLAIWGATMISAIAISLSATNGSPACG